MKLTITKKTGSVDTLNLLSAFKIENNTYVVLDSEKTGSMGLPIIYVTKLTTHFEKITDDNEWQSVKNYLKGIINGTNFEYVNINPTETADEAYYKELSLPNMDAFNAIKNRYNPAPQNSDVAQTITPEIPVVTPVEASSPNVEAAGTPVNPIPVINEPVVNVAPTTPIIPNIPTPSAPVVEPVTPVNEPVITPATPSLDFQTDKETFLKACENMFDALIAKYQKELASLNEREQALKIKEQEIAAKMASASEHLANAEAKEQVANIAHDNAKRIMDLNNIMPTEPVNPNN